MMSILVSNCFYYEAGSPSHSVHLLRSDLSPQWLTSQQVFLFSAAENDLAVVLCQLSLMIRLAFTSRKTKRARRGRNHRRLDSGINRHCWEGETLRVASPSGYGSARLVGCAAGQASSARHATQNNDRPVRLTRKHRGFGPSRPSQRGRVSLT